MREIIVCLAVVGALSAAGCTERAWYEGTKQSQRNECYKMPPSAREECLKALESEGYDEYQRQRQEELKK
ncbi:hypothetical protein SCL_1335 [Sulfuricaulis limicola]|uniref:Lipoprotein n=1 Tax=Sulfuricaulis limicola TaxID=1620215 RepID=A0A1B4XFT1_9GAMM|nr:hypothetical protein [Sulfuricaulis limicola]BAV33646.1 hypothetical protein SCL_1335 [Sulfuricaulis limicola]